MIKIGDKLISDELGRRQFVCDLEACKGACCVQGEGGAPLDRSELPVLEEIMEVVRPYLAPAHQKALDQQGPYVEEHKDFFATPLRDGQECAYTVFKDGKANCGIEMAWKDGKIDFQKPVSCHLYPIRVKQLKGPKMLALNYEEWDICDPACALGKKLKVPVYRFLKDAIIRAYGEAFYEELDQVMISWLQQDA